MSQSGPVDGKQWGYKWGCGGVNPPLLRIEMAGYICQDLIGLFQFFFERLQIEYRDLAAFNLNHSSSLQPAQAARDQLPHRPDLRCKFLLICRKRDFNTARRAFRLAGEAQQE